ncbi:MAG: hypothetical protein RBU30_22215 [Polyangia bacterium]|nr:hypothetical protein [Polyangia bacterium]
MTALRRLVVGLALAIVASSCGDDGGSSADAGNHDTGQAHCGNGRVDVSEECDNGENNSDSLPNACRTNCVLPFCGDGVQDDGEACDQGASNSDYLPDTCRADCSAPRCGDSVIDVEHGETCDPGEELPTATCSASCQAIYCGNGFVDADEACDDGNNEGGDGCSPDCRSDESCGNGIVDLAAGESCDDGENNADVPNALCRTDCQRTICGDGLIDDLLGEDCDGTHIEGVTCQDFGYHDAPGLACSSYCRFDTKLCTGYCGDGVLNGSEDCDGADLGGRTCQDFGYYDAAGLGCSPLCTFTKAACQGFCGDGEVNGGEDCDGAPPLIKCADYGYDAGLITCSRFCTPSFKHCIRFGWNIETSGTTEDFQDFWGSAPNNVWSTGSSIRHFDGTAWTESLPTITGNYPAIWGYSADAVFATAGSGNVVEWNGTSWTTMSTSTTYGCHGIWGSSPTNVYAVCDNGATTRYNGSSWSSVSTGAGTHQRNIWGSGPNDIFVTVDFGRIRHFNGTSWSGWNVGSNHYWGIWGSGPNDVFVSSGDPWAGGGSGTIQHYNGTSWAQMTIPTTQALWSMWGSAPNDVYAVGDSGTILHYDGATWSLDESPSSMRLYRIWGFGPGNAYIGGAGGLLLHHSGVEFKSVGSGTTAAIYDVWEGAASHTFAVGNSGLILRYDGTGWSTITPALTPQPLNAVHGVGTGFAIAVGNGGVILQWNGTSWAAMTSGTIVDLTDVQCFAVGDCLAVGYGGVAIRLQGGSWSAPQATGTTQNIMRMWASASSDVHALAYGGVGLHYNGTAWSTLPVPTEVRFIFGMWGSGPEDIYACGEAWGYGPFAMHFDGTAWTLIEVGTNVVLRGAGGTGPNDVFMVNDTGIVFHFDGTRWSSLRSPFGARLWGVSATPKRVWAVGILGTLLRLDRKSAPPIACAPYETDCLNGVDDDCDMLRDWVDPDCTSDGPCAGYVEVHCGETVTGSNVHGGSLMSQYTCSPRIESGPELFYRIVRPTSGTVTARLVGPTADLDLVAVGSTPAGACTPSTSCLAASSHSSGNEEVSFPASAQVPYYLIVDGFDDATGTFALEVTCP